MTMRRRARCVPIAGLAVLTAACGGESAPRDAGGPWLLPAAVGENTALYFTLRNPGDTAMVITSVEMDVATSAGLQRTVTADGGVREEPVDSLVVPPHDSVQLRADGVHVVGRNLVAPLQVDDTVVVRLQGHPQPVMVVEGVVRPAPAPR